jgi:hypothetical protein
MKTKRIKIPKGSRAEISNQLSQRRASRRKERSRLHEFSHRWGSFGLNRYRKRNWKEIREPCLAPSPV